jgi:hypothetical protein
MKRRATRYQLTADSRARLKDAFRWQDGSDSTSEYRIAWRKMTDNSGQRSIIASLVPPGVWLGWSLSGGKPVEGNLLEALGALSSLIGDFVARAAQKNNISAATLASVPRFNLPELRPEFRTRVLEMIALTPDYAALWNSAGVLGERISRVSARWTPEVARISDHDRYQGLVEIDALMALSVGVAPDDVSTLARAQYPVFWSVQSGRTIDAHGWFVPNEVLKVWKQKGDAISLEERQAVHPGSGVAYTYELPFVTLDREADMRQAYAHFGQILKERS